MGLSNHLYILTGASRGLGLAMAEQLLRPGHSLICISRGTHAGLARAAQAQGAQLVQWQQDLADSQTASLRLTNWLALQPADRFASVTLINNAGVLARIAPLRDASAADLANALRVGLEAPMLLTAAFLSGTRHWAVPRKVLNISSGLGRRPQASQAPYCAAKAGMDLFTQAVALEEAGQPNPARLCSLAPGVIDTDMQVQMRSPDAGRFPDVGRYAQLHEGGQLNTPEAAAEAVLAHLARPDFGDAPLADVRDAPA
ncbi:short-chain dehydrogenase [Comamonas serinivorans]|uniref:Short-chain dehydrogenase n=1 Tax=Comamonas serinivorans TaxID=1082851 RepID=A0A1Y0ENZ7_9BURK|nr:SDR family NAD(P)-dependent oxidoreductase [Comamonas serinivorans]ARU05365.1 short-chain dehydrogenase [Comamonas serinivorans]